MYWKRIVRKLVLSTKIEQTGPWRELKRRCLEYAFCRFRSIAAERRYFDLTHLLIIDKELLDLLHNDRRQICQLVHFGKEQRGLSDRDDAVIAFAPCLALVDLPRQQHTSEPAVDLATRKGWLIAEHERIKGSPSSARVPGKKPKSKGKTVPSGITLESLKRPLFSSSLYLLRLPRGVSMTTGTIPTSSVFAAFILFTSAPDFILQASPRS